MQGYHLIVGRVVRNEEAQIWLSWRVSNMAAMDAHHHPHPLPSTAAMRVSPALPPGTMHTLSAVYCEGLPWR